MLLLHVFIITSKFMIVIANDRVCIIGSNMHVTLVVRVEVEIPGILTPLKP
jgi:hypothetical protein